MGAVTRLTAAGVLLVALVLRPAAVEAEDAQRAKEMFHQGSVYFDLGQYDRAIEVWQKGYEEKQDPGFLYNIAQAHRLSGNPAKAILFYKSFLRNSPKASNRAEIEERIATLQSQVSGAETTTPKSAGPGGSPADGTPSVPPPNTTLIRGEGAAGATSGAGAPGATAPAPPSGGAGENPVAKDTLKGQFPPARRTEVVVSSTTAAPEAAPSNRRFDVGASAGGNVWMSGVQQGSTPSSFAAAVSAGYTFPDQLAGRVRFRLGALGAYSFLHDTDGTANFFSALLDPGIQVRLSPERVFLDVDVGVGVLALAGLKPSSALLVKNQPLAVSGTQSLFEVRPGVAAEYRLSPALAVRAGAALAYTPKRTYFHESIVRLNFQAGFSFLF